MICRACGQELRLGDVFCDLGCQPLANGLRRKEDLGQPQVYYPLRPLICWNCSLVQLPNCPEPDMVFTASYPFYAGQSVSWMVHCQKLADTIIERYQLGSNSRVLDIGSNDGTMLRRFRGRGVPAIGVEPCAEVAQHALMEGLPTIVGWWGEPLASKLLSTKGIPTGKGWKADVVTCTNVLAHVPSLLDFLTAIKRILAPDGKAVIEVPYLGDLVQDCQFDQVYAEHHCYFSATSLRRALQRVSMRMVSAEHIGVHGGSLRIEADTGNYSATTPELAAFLKSEQEQGFADPLELVKFAPKPGQAKAAAWAKLSEHAGKRIVGYGASAKATVTLNYFGIGPDLVQCVADITPTKQNKYIPGCHIPVVPEEALRHLQPDVVVNFCWNWAQDAERRIRQVCPDAEILYLHDFPVETPAIQAAA